MENSKPVKAIIFCGGVGTRMWPMSRKDFPKQFQSLVGEQSMFQATVRRVLKSFDPKDVYVSTGSEYLSFVRKQAPEIPKSNIIGEPVRRDTLGAVGLANLFVYKKFPDAIVAAIWGADHIVQDEKEFGHAIKTAAKYAAKTNKLVKIDVRPTFPSEHNGWVKIGKAIEQFDDLKVHEFQGFIEKPNEEKAKRLFKSRDYLINTGYLVWSAELMHQLFKKHQPKAYSLLEQIKPNIGTLRQGSSIKKNFPLFEKISVDYGIFEKLEASNTVVIPVDIGWIDVGTWELLFEGVVENKRKDNLTKGLTQLNNVQRSIIYSNVPNKVVSVLGVSDVIVVDTEDGLIVCSMHESDKIKDLVNKMKEDEKLKKFT